MKMKKTNIPKIIHYCWFGGKELPELAVKCIESWKKNLPDYEIKRWDESNCDLTSNTYVKEAYENKKWAFVADYVRLHVLKEYGGIYLDTDVEVLKNFDELLHLVAFTGFESESEITTGILASKKNGKWVTELLKDYDNRHFVLEDGSFDYTTNVVTITNITKKMFKLEENNSYQDFKEVTFYPKDYFCPKDHLTNKINLTENTYCIHHFAATWLKPSAKVKLKIFRLINKVFGEKVSRIVHKVYRILNKTPNE